MKYRKNTKKKSLSFYGILKLLTGQLYRIISLTIIIKNRYLYNN